MWESLPPVATSSATPANEMTGVSVAVHATGMLNAQNAGGAAAAAGAAFTSTASNSYAQSNATPISRSLNGTTTTTNNNSVTYLASTSSRPGGALSAPAMSTVVPASTLTTSNTTATTTAIAGAATGTAIAGGAATAPNSNPFATPRESSLTSMSTIGNGIGGGNGGPTNGSGGRDLSARSNLTGASPSPQLFPPVAGAAPQSSSSLTAAANSGVNCDDSRSYRPALPSAAVPLTTTTTATTAAGNGLSARDYLATPHACSTALPAPLLSNNNNNVNVNANVNNASLTTPLASPPSLQQGGYRPQPPLPLPIASAPASCTSTMPPPSSTTNASTATTAALPAPGGVLSSSGGASPLHNTQTSTHINANIRAQGGQLHSPLPPPTAASPTSSHPSLRTSDASTSAVITRSVSPRHPRAVSGPGPTTMTSGVNPAAAATSNSISASLALTAGDSLAPAASPMNASTANAPWQSPGSISITSARLTNDPTSLYFSPAMSEYAGDALQGSSPSGYGGRGAASAARLAPPHSPSMRRYPTNTSAAGNNGNAALNSTYATNMNNNNNIITNRSANAAMSTTSGMSGIPAVRLDLTSLQVDASTPITTGPVGDSNSAGGAFPGPVSRLPQTMVTPTHYTDAVPGNAVTQAAAPSTAAPGGRGGGDGAVPSMPSQASAQPGSRFPPGSDAAPLPGALTLTTTTTANNTTVHNTSTANTSVGDLSTNQNNSSISNATIASGTSLTFVSPSFQVAGAGLEESLISNSLSGAVPMGLTAVARSHGSAHPAGAIAGAPLPRTPQLLQPATASAATVTANPNTTTTTMNTNTTTTNNSRTAGLVGSAATTTTTTAAATTTTATTAAMSGFASHGTVTRAPNERGGVSELVRVVGTESGASSLMGPPVQPPSLAGRERVTDVAPHRYGGGGVGSVGGRTPPNGMLTPDAHSAGPPALKYGGGGPAAAAAAAAAAAPPFFSGPTGPVFSAATPHAATNAHAHLARPTTPAQDCEGANGVGGRVSPQPPYYGHLTPQQQQQQQQQQHHVSIAPHTVSPPPASGHASFSHAHGLPLSFAQGGGSHHNGLGIEGSALDPALHVSLAPGSIDHNQSFYLGTTGNDNLRRSFFFPPTARPPYGEAHEDGTASVGGGVGEDAVNNHSADLASYLRHPSTAAHASSAERPSTSYAAPAATPCSSAAGGGGGAGVNGVSANASAAGGEGIGKNGVASVSAGGVSGLPLRSASAAVTEATEGGDRYCSPVLYRVPSFPSQSPSQPSMPQPQVPPPLQNPFQNGMNGPSTVSQQRPASTLQLPLQPQAAQAPTQQQQQQLPYAVPFPGAPSASTQSPAHPQRSLPEEPLRIVTGTLPAGRPYPFATTTTTTSAASGARGGSGMIAAAGYPSGAAPNTSTSASSPYVATSTSMLGGPTSLHRCGSTRATNMAESLRNVTTNTNQSFISPTLANSMMRRRFEDSIASVSEASFALPDSNAHVAAVGAAAASSGGRFLSAKNASGNVNVSPHASSGAAATTSSSSFSAPRTPQKAATPVAVKGPAGAPVSQIAPPAGGTTTAVGPAPAYILDWERSLIAFQNRAESYYTFKDLCTETYLTLIEHDVDRFLVCYYSGGAVKPEEAVQEALASRAGTPAATGAHVFSSTASGGNGLGNNNNGNNSSGTTRGGGLQKMIQTNKTLQKLSEAGSKWFTNLKKTAMTPVPVWGDAKTPSSSVGTATPVRGPGGSGLNGRSGTSSVSSTAVDILASTRSPQPLPVLDSANNHHNTNPSDTAGGARPAADAPEEWWMTTDTTSAGQASGFFQNNNNNASGEPTYSTAEQSTTTTKQEGNATEVGQLLLLDRPLSSSGRSFTTTSTLPDALSTTSSNAGLVGAVVVSTPKKAPLSRLSYNIAAEEELQCLRQLGAYMANVIPETYMDARPSEQVLQHVRRNYPIILNALQHVLMMSGVETAAADTPTRGGGSGGGGVLGGGRHATAEATRMLIASRIRQGLLLPSIQATWRDYLSPLEMKVKELVQIATTNIDPILEELQATPTEGLSAVSAESTSTSSAVAAAAAELEARQRLRALREQPVRRLARLLRGDEEYLTTIHIMDDEFAENGEAWRTRSAVMRGAGAALSDYVPVYGLVLSRLHRLEIEHRTVLELWCGGV